MSFPTCPQVGKSEFLAYRGSGPKVNCSHPAWPSATKDLIRRGDKNIVVAHTDT